MFHMCILADLDCALLPDSTPQSRRDSQNLDFGIAVKRNVSNSAIHRSRSSSRESAMLHLKPSWKEFLFDDGSAWTSVAQCRRPVLFGAPRGGKCGVEYHV